MLRQAVLFLLIVVSVLTACPANYNLPNLTTDSVTFTTNANAPLSSQTFAYSFVASFSAPPAIAIGLQDFSLSYVGANNLAVYPSSITVGQVIFNWDYSSSIWSRVRFSFLASTHSQMQLGSFKVDSIQIPSSSNTAQVYTTINTPFAQGDTPVIRAFINGFDISGGAVQISVNPSNLQGTKLTITVSIGAGTILKRVWLSWLAFSPTSSSIGSYGGQYSQSKYSGTTNSDISNSLYNTPYIFHGINVLSISNTQALTFTSSVDSSFILTVTASRVVDDFSVVYIAVGVQPSKVCSQCGNGLVASGANCLSSCAPGTYSYTYKDGGVGCRTCSSKVGLVLANDKCIQGTTSAVTTTNTIILGSSSTQSNSNGNQYYSADPQPITVPISASNMSYNIPSYISSPTSIGTGQSQSASCPANAYYNGNECVCEVGYVWLKQKCQVPSLPSFIPTTVSDSTQQPSTSTPPSTPASNENNNTAASNQPTTTPSIPSSPTTPTTPSTQPTSSSISCGSNSYNNGLGICVCNQGYYFLNNQCITGTPCSVNSHRNTDGTCSCDSGYTNYSGTCSKCPQGAFWSSSSNQCIFVCGQNSAYSATAASCVCNSGYGLFNGACQLCPQGYFIINGFCVTCPVNSAYNSLTGKCDCQLGYFTNQYGICTQKCGVNQAYNSATQSCGCLQGLGRVNGTCQICPSGSTPAADGSSCSACGVNQVLVNGICGCQQGYAYNSAGVCMACSSLSNGFLVNGICAVCPGSMVYNGNTCACPAGKIVQGSSCISQCQSDEVLDSKGNCYTCQNNQVISNGACVCAPGYSLQSNGVCGVSCSSGQFIYQACTCAACPLNTIFNSAINGCVCPSGYYMDSYNTCQKLVLQGITCPSGQYFDSNSGCLACSSSCKTCKSATQCLTCSATGYSANSQGVCTATCGDGLIVGVETCDTGSAYANGCVNCQIQSGYTCSGQPSVCVSNTQTVTPTPVPTTTNTSSSSSGLSQVGSTSINSNNVFISLQTNPTFTFSSPTQMQNFIQSSFPSGAKPTVYCAQRNSPNLNIFDCLLIYPSGVPNSQFQVNFSYSYQGKVGSTTVKVNPLTASNDKASSTSNLQNNPTAATAKPASTSTNARASN